MLRRLKSSISQLKDQAFLVIISLLFALISTSSKLLIPFLAGKAVNLLKEAAEKGRLPFLDLSLYFLLMGIFLVLGTLFRYLFDFSSYLIGQRVIKKMRKDLFKAELNAPLSYLDGMRKGDLLLRSVNDVETIQTGLVSGLAAFYDGIVAIAITLAFMFFLNWALALIVVSLTPLSMLVSRFVSKFNAKHFQKQASAQASLTAFSLESLNNSEAVMTLGIEEDRIKEFDSHNQKLLQSTFKANLGASAINPSTRLINAIINATLIMVGALFIINEVNLGIVFLIGDLSAFLTYAANYMQPFNEISDVVAEVDYALASLERVEEGINCPKDVDEGKKSIEGGIASLEAKDITFSYDGKKTIIDDFNLKIKKGHKIALVGPTGCGKTTIINLLMRFYDPNKGSFYINGESSLDFPKSEFYRHIGMVLQDTWIFSGTVYENIAYAKENATKEEVYEAARKAMASHFIERLPKGYDTLISDSNGLSKGEKQLICVARVMLLAPEVIVLDEATSNIDVRTEKLLIDSFNGLMAGKTSLVVAHRLSTIASSDLIVVLKEGKIIEMGNHEELLQAKGFYYNLYNAQFN